ncbi:MAG: hypothetical protein ACRDRS_25785, partial [Pseudonocardiaceae bacterium]
GGLCTECSRAVVRRRVEGRPVHWARSPGDLRRHAVEHGETAAGIAVTGWAQALCGARLPREGLDLAAQPSSPLCRWCVTGAVTEPPGASGIECGSIFGEGHPRLRSSPPLHEQQVDLLPLLKN